ncbi:MAG: hypothetical protein M5R40_10525 [Anaerolineae bacterium]|nr:hypothetical protein [Anaerolineae bacterium]
MELHSLFRILLRRWWLIAIPTAVALGYAVLTYTAPPTAYTTAIRFTAAQVPTEGLETGDAPRAAAPYEDSSYVPWLASEYLVNALTAWVQTNSFLLEVSESLTAQGIEISAGELAGAFAADNQRSVMALYITWGDPDTLLYIAEVAVDVMVHGSSQYFPQTAAGPVEVVPLDRISVSALAPPATSRIRPLIPVALGLAAGVALAFLVEYLDPTVRTRADLEALGFAVIAEVPHE